MKKLTFEALRYIFILVIVLAFARPVEAHGEEPRLEVNSDTVNPGAVIDIPGVDFEYEDEVNLSLIGPETELHLVSTVCDTEGVFLLSIMRPFELADGIYTIRPTTDDHQLESAPITVWATAVQVEETGGPIDEGDMLLAPMPTFLPAYPTSVPRAENEEKPTADVTMPMLIAGLLIAIIFFAVLGFGRRQS